MSGSNAIVDANMKGVGGRCYIPPEHVKTCTRERATRREPQYQRMCRYAWHGDFDQIRAHECV